MSRSSSWAAPGSSAATSSSGSSRAATSVVVPTRRLDKARHLQVLPTVNVVVGRRRGAPDVLPRLVERASAVVNLVGILNETGGQHVPDGARRLRACRDRGVPGGRRAPARPHERAQCRSGGTEPLPSQQGRSRGDRDGLRSRLDDLPAVGDLRSRGRFSQSVRAASALRAGDGARAAPMRGSSRSTSAMSPSALSRALRAACDDRHGRIRSAARRSTRCASSSATSGP